ncbi:MAG: metallophosphoesterase family protein [Solirubrobacterales bacterium]|nr:metallophosphoesterase family protein [Solirubrobacterales bacterium]
MLVAAISDIHANLPALESVLADIDSTGVEEIWFLGDAVGYGAQPSECLQLIDSRCSVSLLGNHDLAALGDIDISTFSPGAAHSALWTREKLTGEDLDLLREIGQASGSREGFGLYHASPRDPVWEYVVDTELAAENLDAQTERIALIGHSHIALYFNRAGPTSETSSVLGSEGSSIDLNEGEWLVNPGSVGQPRDGNPRAAWLELDTAAPKATFHRVEYPIDAAAESIREAGLPSHLADRLYQGH